MGREFQIDAFFVKISTFPKYSSSIGPVLNHLEMNGWTLKTDKDCTTFYVLMAAILVCGIPGNK